METELPKNVFMPALGMAQETGLILKWLKAEGEEVTPGEPLLEIETDKATVKIEAPVAGILANISAQAGDEVPVGQVIAVILAPGEKAAAPAAAAVPQRPAAGRPVAAPKPPVLASPVAARLAAEHEVDLQKIRPEGGRIQKADVLAYLETQPDGRPETRRGGRLPASPKARRLAHEQDLDLASVRGSGPDGAVLAGDVLAAVRAPALLAPTQAPAVEPSPDLQTLPLSRIWQVMVRRMTDSWANVPHFFLVREANASRFLKWHDKAQARAERTLTYTDLLVKLVAAALDRHPRMNARWHDDRIVMNQEINVGLAVAVDEGLVVPVIHQAGRLGLNDLAARREELVSRARTGTLSLDDIRDGTFTISNLGMYGVDAFNAIVNPPQAGILAVGRVADRVVPLNGLPAVQPMTTLTLSCDHRVIDGAQAARFFKTLVEFVEDPLGVLD
jgi:pyruvate dehydrogenase E2 component (dihydrolipoamide acetyltransferase)